jgi:ferredoxin
MYVILTTKPGQFRTDAGEGVLPLEGYDYLLSGRLRARFVIAELRGGAARVRIVDDADPAAAVNEVPVKFLPTFEAIEQARAELEHLTRFGDLDAALVRQGVVESAEAAASVVHITFINQNERRVAAPPNSNLLRVSLREQGGIPFKCGGGVCGTCKCRIERGLEYTDAIKPKERKHLSEAQLAQGYRMACQTFVVRGDVAVSW